MAAQTILVTGAYGFLGRYAARQFASLGHYVIGLGHGGWSQAEWREWGLNEWHTADVTLENLTLHGRIPDVVVHCAGSGSVAFSVQQPGIDFRRTVGSTSEVLEFVRLQAPKARLVYPSSAAVYGASHSTLVERKDALMPISPYGVHKLMAEQLCRLYGKSFGIASSVVRLFSVYGPELRKQLLWDACGKITRNEAVFCGNGDESRDWLHASDASLLLTKASEQATPDCPTACGGWGDSVSVKQIVMTLRDSLGASHVEPVFSGSIRAGDPTHQAADTSLASAWGWKPAIHWQNGLKEYGEWFKRCA